MEDRSLLQIKLEKDLGYFYAVFHRGRGKLSTVNNFIYVYFPHFSDDKGDWRKIDFTSYDLLMNPVQISGWPNIRGKHKVKVIKVLEEKEVLFFRPAYIRGVFASRTGEDDEEETIEDFNEYSYSYPYYRVKHLPMNSTCNSNSFIMLVTLVWIRENDWDISDFYSEAERKEDFWIDFAWDEIMRRPKYTSIPKEYRDKVMPDKKWS